MQSRIIDQNQSKKKKKKRWLIFFLKVDLMAFPEQNLQSFPRSNVTASMLEKTKSMIIKHPDR